LFPPISGLSSPSSIRDPSFQALSWARNLKVFQSKREKLRGGMKLRSLLKERRRNI
jgi:hypothetical protein